MSVLSVRSLTSPEFVWQRPLPNGPVLLCRSAGRVPTDQVPSGSVCWEVPWDQCVSNPHAVLSFKNGTLTVHRRLLPSPTTNPVVYRGGEVDDVTLAVGDRFRIGDTEFALVDPGEPTEVTLTTAEVRAARFPDPDLRIDALAGLPELIRQSTDDADLYGRVIGVLLAGVPTASRAAIVRLPSGAKEDESPVVLAKSGPDVVPSRRLVRSAVHERRQCVLHAWPYGDERDDLTVAPGTDWAACVPLQDDLHTDWGLYLSGRRTGAKLGESDLRADLRFAELTADLFASLLTVRFLQQRTTLLGRFLSPKVLTAIAGRDVEDVLRPRTSAVTVLFCDLRGFSRFTEAHASDLSTTWGAVSEALAVMSNAILEYDGVIGDFQGDAALGFWGWPLEESDQVERACRAALHVRKRFLQAGQIDGHRLGRFVCGVGLAHGPAMAGRIGVPDQFKVGVFGPPVNRAARLEGLTKHFQVGILVDDVVAAAVHPTVGWGRVRRVGAVRPVGFDTPVRLAELLPPATDPTGLSDPRRKSYEAAWDATVAGRWADARTQLKNLTPHGDGPSRILQTFLDRYPDGPPAGWDGLLPVDQK